MGRLGGRLIWITGASSGVGEGMARVFHREGAALILSGRRVAELERVRASCAEDAAAIHLLPFDMADGEARAAAADQVLQQFGHLDVLVNNAGISQRALAVETQLEVDRRIMEVDYFGPIDLARRVLPGMIARRSGQLVVTSSVAGKHGVPMRSAYCAAKHALHGYFDTLRIELLEHEIDVILLVIAGVRSEVASHALRADGTETGRDDWEGGAGMSAEDCAELALQAMLNRDCEPVIGIGQALEAMRLKAEDPAAFTQRMASMLRWMQNGTG